MPCRVGRAARVHRDRRRSRSFRFLVRLIERMPVMALPAWRDKHPPIDGRDVLEFLAARATCPPTLGGRSWDIGGPDAMTYAAMIAGSLTPMLGRPSLSIIFTMTPAASVVAAAIAGEDPALIGPLMESLEHTSCQARGGRCRCVRGAVHGFDAAVERRCATGSGPRSWPGDQRRGGLDRDRRPARAGVGRDHGPASLADWVTIHRKLHTSTIGLPREGFEVEQTLCLDDANFKVRRALAECDAPARRGWEGKGPAGSYARIVDPRVALDGARRTRFDHLTSTRSRAGSSPDGGRALVGGQRRRRWPTARSRG